MAALAAAAVENPALAHHAVVTTTGFHVPGIECAKCVHDIVECDRPSSFNGSTAQFRYGLNCASIRCPRRQDRATEDKDRLFSERYYGRFERRIPLDDIDEDKIGASFKNGVLNVILPKSPTAQQKVRRIAINGK